LPQLLLKISLTTLSICVGIGTIFVAKAQTSVCVLKASGDADCNGQVDLNDFQIFRTEFNLARSGTLDITTAKANFNSDNTVDLLDFTIFRKGYLTVTTPTPTATTTPIPSINKNFQPTAPYHATFYYPWSENPNTANTDGIKKWSYWDDSPNGATTKHTPPQNWFSNYLPDPNPEKFDPTNELYSSFNDQNIYWQLSKMKEAKQEVGISSWWGQGHKTDKAFKKIITDIMNRSDNPYPNLRWGLYYENEGFGDPSTTQLISDLQYIKQNYADQPGMLKIDGKVVVFVYGDATDDAEMADRWATARAAVPGIYTVLKVYPGYTTDATKANSWHQYSPAGRSDQQGNYSYSISPGFWLNGQEMRLCRNLDGAPQMKCKSDNPTLPVESFKTAIQNMVSANTAWKLVETWNEWGEGTGVEPAQKVNQVTTGTASLDTNEPSATNSNAYVSLLNQLLPPLETSQASSPTPTFTPTPTPITNQSITVAAVGDMVPGKDTICSVAGCKQKEVSDVIISMKPDAYLALGDVQYEGGAYNDFLNYYDPSYGRFKDKTFPAVGNHEYSVPKASGYFDYYNGIGKTTGNAGDRDKGYYAYNLGSWRLYVLNSNCSQVGGCAADSAQGKWLQADLNANPKKCSLLYTHHPYWVSQTGYNNPSLRPLVQMFYNSGGEVMLTGHSHFYERFAPMDSNGTLNETKGVRQFVVGTGGKNVYQPNSIQPNSLVRDGKTFGALKLVLNSNNYEWKFQPIVGQTFTDAGTDVCH
jgi:hypothetical protein